MLQPRPASASRETIPHAGLFQRPVSERHLALDASEKQAFAETYLAMKEGAGVGSDNEAIVLASLFRPTQDGIIKDDDSTLDMSAAALIAKQLGRVPG